MTEVMNLHLELLPAEAIVLADALTEFRAQYHDTEFDGDSVIARELRAKVLEQIPVEWNLRLRTISP